MTETTIQLLQPIPAIPSFALVKIPAGSFIMGDEADTYSQPLTQITFADDFYMGQYPVTQELWQHIMGDNPAYFKGTKRPVEYISWDAICNKGGFLDKLNEQAAIKALLAQPPFNNMRFALPSEAQWEYAARGGAEGQLAGFEYAGSNDIDEVAWYDDNSHDETKPVGLKAPNVLGLYDMSGNVWEWCADYWVSDYSDIPTNGRPRIKTPERTSLRVIRGGCYFYGGLSCRTAYRYYFGPDGSNGYIGFRLALSGLTPAPLQSGEG